MLRPAGSVVEVGSLVAAACGWRESAARAHDGLDEYHRVVEGASHRQRPARAADLIEASVSDTLTRHSFRDIHWRKIRTNHPLERSRERFTAGPVVLERSPTASHPQPGSRAVRYIAAWSANCYMNIRPLY